MDPRPSDARIAAAEDAKVAAAAAATLEEYLSPAVWDLQTSFDGNAAGERYSSSSHPNVVTLSLATLRDNASLVTSCVEGVGAFSNACGDAYVHRGNFLTAALCPLLRRLGDDNVKVSDAAAAALRVVAHNAGHGVDVGVGAGGTRKPGSGSSHQSAVAALVVANADHVVDMLSRHLRHLDDHPDAPSFFAAVFGGEVGAARAALPLLREPLGRALDAISIQRRRKNWRHACAFLGVAREVCRAVSLEGEEGLRDARNAAATVAPLRELLREMEDRRADAAAAAADDDADDDDDASVDATLAAVIQNSPHRAACAAINVPAIITDWCVRVRSAASSSALASDVLAASAPLLQSEDAKTRIRAADACREAVLALAVVERQAKEETATHETLKRLYPHDVPVIVSEAETPKKLLPRVHALWPHLVMSLGHRLGPAVKPDALKASLELLIATATASKGGFIARRVASELWPWLRRVIDRGVAHVGGLGGEFGGVASSRLDKLYVADEAKENVFEANEKAVVTVTVADDVAPRQTDAVRISIFDAIARMCEDEDARGAIADVAGCATRAALPFAVGDASSASSRRPSSETNQNKTTGEVRRAAERALRGLAKVDEDAVWCALASVATGRRGAETPTPPRWDGAFYTLVPIRPRSRGERRSLKTFSPGVSLRPGSHAFNPDTPRRLSTPLLTPMNSTPTSLCMDPRPSGNANANGRTKVRRRDETPLPTLPSFREISPLPRGGDAEVNARASKAAFAIMATCGMAGVAVGGGDGK